MYACLTTWGLGIAGRNIVSSKIWTHVCGICEQEMTLVEGTLRRGAVDDGNDGSKDCIIIREDVSTESQGCFFLKRS